VAVLAWRLVARHALSLSGEYTYMATECRIDSILYGALLRLLFESRWAVAAMRLLRGRACRVLALLALLATFAIRDEGFRQTFRYTIQGIALMPFFAALLSDVPETWAPQAWARRALASPPMVLIGRLSYAIYLFHLPARTPGEAYFGSPYRAGSVVSGLIVTLALAYLLFVLVERPVAGLRRRFRAHAPGTVPAAPALDPRADAATIALSREPTAGA
jgi:peptidoglycan/LPS O-acetylase OafA/YrhL